MGPLGSVIWGACCVVWENYVDMCVHVFIANVYTGLSSGFLLLGRQGYFSVIAERSVSLTDSGPSMLRTDWAFT